MSDAISKEKLLNDLESHINDPNIYNAARAAYQIVKVKTEFGCFDTDGWISVKDRLPETKTRVLVSFQNNSGKCLTTCAEYIAPRTVLMEDYVHEDQKYEFFDYDEESDTYWTPSGFYEWSYESEINYQLTETVTHWIPLPKPPKGEDMKPASWDI